jgi:hypothetical protein
MVTEDISARLFREFGVIESLLVLLPNMMQLGSGSPLLLGWQHRLL